MSTLDTWLQDYVTKQREVYAALPLDQVAAIVDLLRDAHAKARRSSCSATAAARRMRRTL